MAINKPNHKWNLILSLPVLAGLLLSLVIPQPAPVDAIGLGLDGPESKAIITLSYTTY